MFPLPSSSRSPAPSRLRGPVGIAASAKQPPWGWPEWFLVTQGALPALMFMPGAAPLRTLTRAATFVIPLMAWLAIWQKGRQAPRGTAPFAPVPWLLGISVWLCLSIFHPTTNALMSGLAQAAMYVAVLSPAFWAPAAVVSGQQIPRLMMITFVANAVSALVGIGQVYRPITFNPPVIAAFATNDHFAIGGGTYQSSDGHTIIRPCGLSDNIGGAGTAGMVTCLLGLCLATRPMAVLKRLTCFGMALVGMADIYFCQIRTAMVMEFVCIIALVILLAGRGFHRQAASLVVGIGLIVFLAAGWAVSAVGTVSTDRFMTLVAGRPDELYGRARGGFVQDTFENLIWEYPLGGGLGRWGQALGNFGDNTPSKTSGQIWVEVEWPGWVIDGGILLLIAYPVAVALAMASSVRIVRTCKDRELAYWGAVICALNLAVVATTFSACPFVANSGAGFWLLAATLHGASEQSRLASQPRKLVASQ